jgi:hypothetical protein
MIHLTPGVEYRPVRDDAAADLSAWSPVCRKAGYSAGPLLPRNSTVAGTRGSGLLGIRLCCWYPTVLKIGIF